MIKQILIPVAAFAVTVSAASAFNSDMLKEIDVDLSDSQISALEEVHEMREDGADRDEVHAILEAAGLDQDDMTEIRTAMHELRDERHEAVEEALEAGDYDAFVAAVAGTPRADNLPSEADFEKFVEAHELREAGDHDAARAIMEELGIERGPREGQGFGSHRGGKMQNRDVDAGYNGEKSGRGGFNQSGSGRGQN